MPPGCLLVQHCRLVDRPDDKDYALFHKEIADDPGVFQPEMSRRRDVYHEEQEGSMLISEDSVLILTHDYDTLIINLCFADVKGSSDGLR